MIEAGLLAEVRALRKRGYGPTLRPLQAIGYRHMHPVVDGLDTLVNAVAAMKRDTRRFARRQRTWLRAVPGICWHTPDDEAGIAAAVERFLAESEEAGWRDTPARTP
jgi:tRNA dimethylallyltransferase